MLREVHEEIDFGEKKCHTDRRFETEFPQDTNAHTNCSSELLQSFKLLPLPNLLEKMRANLSFTHKGRAGNSTDQEVEPVREAAKLRR